MANNLLNIVRNSDYESYVKATISAARKIPQRMINAYLTQQSWMMKKHSYQPKSKRLPL